MKLLDLLIAAAVLGVAALLLWSSGESAPGGISAGQIGSSTCAFVARTAGATAPDAACRSTLTAAQSELERQLVGLARGGLGPEVDRLLHT
jgi:hypothetical protein